MRLYLGLVTAFALQLSTSCQGQDKSAEIAFTGFLDPVENGFTLDVPQGWTVRGGMLRVTAAQPTMWVTAISPDGTMQAFVGDPTIPLSFVEPYGSLREGDLAPSNGRVAPSTVLRYRHATEFAQTYGTRVLPGFCADLASAGTRPLPDYPRPAEQQHPQNEREGAIAEFTCAYDGTTYRAGVIAVTGVLARMPTTPPAAQGGLVGRVPSGLWAQGPQLLWNVPSLSGFAAPAGQQNAACQILTHMIASIRLDPDWRAAQSRIEQAEIARQNQEGEQARAAMVAQAREFTATLLAQGDAAQASRMRQHAAFMQQQQAEASMRTQNFVANYLRKTIDTSVFIHSYVQGQTLVCSQQTGTCQWVGGR